MGTTSLVGPLTLPIPAGTAGQRLVDPAVDYLLAFLGWTLRNTLDAKLATHTGIVATGATPTAVAVANQFSYSPLEPRATKVRLPVPSLWLWWDGESVSREWTLCKRIRERQYKALWLFPELPKGTEMQRRQGLYSAADAAFARAAERGRHPLYSYTDTYSGTVYPAGMPIAQMLGDRDAFSWEYIGGMAVRWGIEDADPDAPGSNVAERCRRDWPGLAAKFRVQELIGADVLEDPADVNRDMQVSIYGTDGGFDETTWIMDRTLGAPDGSEDLD
jgi:hypothetical protein